MSYNMADIEYREIREESPSSRSSSGKMAKGCRPHLKWEWTRKLRFKMKKIFGRKSKDDQSNSSIGRDDNPYAQNANAYSQSPDPYASSQQAVNSQTYMNSQPYASSQSSFRTTQSGSSIAPRQGLPAGPRPGGLARQQPPPRLPSYDSVAPPRYSDPSQSGSGYRDEKLGSSEAIGGANRYNANAAAFNSQYSATSVSSTSSPRVPDQRPGGWGGFNDSPSSGSTSSAPPPRYSPARTQGGWDSTVDTSKQPGAQRGSYDNNKDFGDGRQLTEKEQEEQEADGTKTQIIEELRAGNRVLGNALGISRDLRARTGGMHAMADEQGESLDKSDKHLDRSKGALRIGHSAVKELIKLDETPFFLPAISKKKLREQEQAKIQSEMLDIEMKDETRQNSYAAFNRKLNATERTAKPVLLGERSSKKDYTFEDMDGEQGNLLDEGDEMLDELYDNVTFIKGSMGQLGSKIGAQSKQIARMEEKASDRRADVTKANVMISRMK